jgi:hypothetical protein
VAFGKHYPRISEQQLVNYEAAIAICAKSPRQPLRTLRYQAVQWLVGRRPFATYLDRDKFHIELRRDTAAAKAA